MRDARSRHPEEHDRNRKQRGQAFVEYVLLVLVIAIVAIFVVKGLGKSVGTTFHKADEALQENNPKMENVSTASFWQRIRNSR